MTSEPLTLIPEPAHDALLAAGVLVTACEPGNTVALRIPAQGRSEASLSRLTVNRIRGALSHPVIRAVSADLETETGVLVVCDRVSPRALSLAKDLRVSVIALSGPAPGATGHLFPLEGAPIPLGHSEASASHWPTAPGPAPWGRLAVARALVLLGARTQTEMAALTGLTQPRVSQIYRTLIAEGLLADRGRQIPNWGHLVDYWLATYPGPGGVTTYWFGLAPVGEQARTVAEHLAGLESRPVEALISGEAAADLLSPWGRPSTSVVYARAGATLEPLLLTPCPANQATLQLTVPRDPGVWQLTGQLPPGLNTRLPLADPLQVLYDLQRSTGPDALETAARLRQELSARVR